jgi:hypothetical protein
MTRFFVKIGEAEFGWIEATVMGYGSSVTGSSNGGRAPKNILKLKEPKLSILLALNALVTHVISVGLLV